MESQNCKCLQCEKRDIEDQQSEEIGLAFLIAMMPIIALTLFSNMGLL